MSTIIKVNDVYDLKKCCFQIKRAVILEVLFMENFEDFLPDQLLRPPPHVVHQHSLVQILPEQAETELKGLLWNLKDSPELKGLITARQSTELKGMSTELKGLSTELKGMSTEFKGMSMELKGMSTELKGLLSELKVMSTELKRLSTELKGMSTQLKGL